jgi:hypothetical protein
MLRAIPVRYVPASSGPVQSENTVPERLVLTEADLASRWAMSPKTLQRWRMEGRGPFYLKMGRRVNYPLNAVIAFESCIQHVSTSQKLIA